MKKLATFSIYVVLSFVVLLISCKKELESVLQPDSPESSITRSNYRVAADGQIVLGQKLENPYTVETMKKAFLNLVKRTKGKVPESKSTVRTTHYYVRFLPQNWKQYDLLKADTTIKLSEIPLDYEIKLHGNKYHDKAVCDSCPTWQYTSVKKEFKFDKKTKYEILSELYIPETDATLAKQNITEKLAGKSFLDALIDEAMILTKNFGDTLNTKKRGRTAWNPSGTIQVFDTRLNKLIPLIGVEVCARRWFTTYSVTTNQNGYYYSPWGYDRPANYSLYFETWAFDVRSGTFGQAWIDGPKQDSPWDLDITQNTLDAFYANVFRGAWRYFFGDIGGLRRPVPLPIKYAAMNSGGGNQGFNIGSWSFFQANPNIFIYRFRDGSDYNSDEIFSTTCHETAHSTHINLMNGGLIQYSQVTGFIRESWPTVVEWYITQKEYKDLGISDYGGPQYNGESPFNTPNQTIPFLGFPNRFGHQRWQFGQGIDNYSSIFIDIVDDNNQAVTNGSTITDNLTGYTIPGIESNFLKHVYGLSSLRDQLKANKPSGVTDAQIDQLINQF